MAKAKIQRKPDIELNIATYRLNGQLNQANTQELLSRIDGHLSILRGMHIDGLLLSFEGITQIDKYALEEIIKSFSSFYVRLRTMVGFCDYTASLYPILRKLMKQTPLGLYKSVEIMALAVGTSNINRNASILIYAEDISERQLIASTLISNEYFVIMALSLDDFKKKIKDKSRYDRIVYNSYFSNIHDDVIIHYDEKAFIYCFQGTLDKTLNKRINIDNYKYRLSNGYTVVIFDFTNIYNLNIAAAHFLIELEKIAKEYFALICCIGLTERKVEVNSFSVLEKSSLWLYDDIEQIYDDKDVIEVLSNKKQHYYSGISKKLLELSPHFVAASMQALAIYEIPNVSKEPSKQSDIKTLYNLKPFIMTHIAFNGDYEGELTFLFSKEIVKIFIKQFFIEGESYKKEDYLDAMSEFVNALTGRLKSNLRKRNMCIQFSLPYSSAKLDDVMHIGLDQKFILTNFLSDKSNYHVSLCSPIDIDI